MPIVGGLDIHRKQLTFDYGCGSFRVRAGQAPSVYWSCVVPG